MRNNAACFAANNTLRLCEAFFLPNLRAFVRLLPIQRIHFLSLFPMCRIILSSFALFVGCGMTLFAQNLIPNPSFEDCTSPPDAECRLDKVKGGWFNPVGRDDGYPYASPDYKSAKGSNQAKLPKSYHGYTEPQEGSAVVGLIPYAGWIND